MNGASTGNAIVEDVETRKQSQVAKKPGPLRTVSWNETVSEGDFEIPGTPRTPRTSTTPGTLLKIRHSQPQSSIFYFLPNTN